MPALRRPRLLMAAVAIGLFVSGVTIWPWELELELVLSVLDTLGGPAPLVQAIQTMLHDMRLLREMNSPVLYVADWLAYAHIVLAALFVMALRDPVRNILVVRFGILCCLGVPLLAVGFAPLRGLPWFWVLIDSSFALAAIPLWVALRDLRALESQRA